MVHSKNTYTQEFRTLDIQNMYPYPHSIYRLYYRNVRLMLHNFLDGLTSLSVCIIYYIYFTRREKKTSATRQNKIKHERNKRRTKTRTQRYITYRNSESTRKINIVYFINNLFGKMYIEKINERVHQMKSKHSL